MNDRNDSLDGLRAVAAFAVVAFHAHVWRVFPPAWLGWAGVDVFFVLSGYLITGVLLTEREASSRIRLGAFYVRRATRLYPALILAVGLTLAVTDSTGRLGGLVTLAYLSDFWQAAGKDLGALLPTWSLAIEEQFYLFWPLVLLACRSRAAVTRVALGLAGASLVTLLVWSAPLAEIAPGPYNSPHTRMWELLVGCALASSYKGLARRRLGWVLLAGGVLGAAALGAAGSPFQSSGLIVAAAAIGAATVVLVESGGLRWLSWRPLPQLGRISYGIYLFHLPLFFTIAPDGQWLDLLVSVLATVALAALSYRYVEQPVRRWGRRLVHKPAPSVSSVPQPAAEAS